MRHRILIGGSSRYPVDRARLRQALLAALAKENLPQPVEISLQIVGSRKMKQLNQQYRGKDYATNVLSFCLQEISGEQEEFVFPDNQTLYLGETVICYPVARDEAGEYGMRVDDWIEQLALHSLEHLLGRHHPGD